MPLPSFLQRFRRKASSGQATEAVSLSPSDVEETRARARRRLVGMVVLVVAGLIGFPWLFETQPRSMSSDVQIVQAGADAEMQISGAVPARSPRSAAGRVAVSGIVAPPVPADQDEPPAKAVNAGKASKAPVETVIDEPAPRAAPHAVAASKPAAKAVAKASEKSPEKASDKSSDKSTDKPGAKAAAKEAARDAAKDKDKDKPKEAAKSNDKPADKDKADKAAARYVVQFGAFADVNTAHEARMKIERLGVRTYAQQVDTPAGKRIRVRMGPYADKAEAEKAMATLRKAGLNGALLTL